jgi:mandelate racemase
MSARGGLVIRALRARGPDLALARPVETAAGVMRTAPLALVDLATEAGVTGCGYVRCYTPVALDPLVRLIANLEELVNGEPAGPAAVQDKLQRQFRLLGPQGLTGIAMAAIDMALWDACAKAAGVPLVTLLGGRPGPIPAYASLRSMRPAAAAADAEELDGAAPRRVGKSWQHRRASAGPISGGQVRVTTQWPCPER